MYAAAPAPGSTRVRLLARRALAHGAPAAPRPGGAAAPQRRAHCLPARRPAVLVYVILAIVTVCVTIVVTYFLLNNEDYRWVCLAVWGA